MSYRERTNIVNEPLIRYKAIFFDFDGVILDSTNIKTEAFRQMFQKYGCEIEQAVVEYHQENEGISRFVKLKYWYETLLHQSLSDEELQRLGEVFSSIVKEQVMQAPFIAGAIETLEQLRGEGIPAYIISGTPEQELQEIVKERQLNKYFRGIYGSPKTKVEIIRTIIKEEGYKPEEIVFFGDAMTDYLAANETGIHFIGIVNRLKENIFPEGTVCRNAVII